MRLPCAGRGFALTLEALLSILLAATLILPFLHLTRSALEQKHAFLYDEQLLDDVAEVAYRMGVFSDIAGGDVVNAEAKLGRISARLGACLRVERGGFAYASPACGSSTRKITTTRLLANPGQNTGYDTITFTLER